MNDRLVRLERLFHLGRREYCIRKTPSTINSKDLKDEEEECLRNKRKKETNLSHLIDTTRLSSIVYDYIAAIYNNKATRDNSLHVIDAHGVLTEKLLVVEERCFEYNLAR